jgi:tRNA(fMet)-specific endonuclease VapC
MSAISLSEVFLGAGKGAKLAQTLAVVEEFVSLLEALPCSAKALCRDGTIGAALGQTGRPIGVDDLHIAAHARGEGPTVVTDNLAGFERVPGLLTENGVDAPG